MWVYCGGKKTTVEGSMCHTGKMLCFPDTGTQCINPSFVAVPQLLNSMAQAARHCRTDWRARRTCVKGGLEIQVEKMRLCLFF